MKRLFNRTKRPVEQWNERRDDDWDEGAGDGVYEDAEDSYGEDSEDGEDSEGDYYEDEEGSYEDGEDSEEGYYEDEEGSYEDGEDSEEGYYEDGEDSEGDYYEDEEGSYEDGEDSEGDYYEDEEGSYEDGEDSEGDYYGDEEGSYEDGEDSEEGYYEDEEGSYEDEEGSEEDLYGDEEGYYGDESDAEDGMAEGDADQSGEPRTIWDKIAGMSGLDRVIAITGAAVLLLAVVTAGVYFSASIVKKQVSEFVAVGKQLEGIDTIGERGLVALADSRLAMLAAAAVVEEPDEKKDYQEADYTKSVTVALELTSILKDLKVKFTNKQTGKLVANVPFAVTVTKPDGKTEIWSDDDMDGIIYKKDIEAGSYKVSVNALDAEKYKNYTTPKGEKSVEVKKDITYKKVDVTNEIKKESEINTAKEEAKKDQIQVESVLKDTVAWVGSTVTASTYREISKAAIPDPRAVAKSGAFLRMVDSTNPTDSAGSSTSSSSTPSSSTSSSSTPSSSTSSSSTASSSATPPAETAALTLDSNAVSIKVGETKEIQATVTSAPAGQTVTAASDKPGVATVSVAGNKITITGVAAGSATITVTYPTDTAKTATCTVTVEAAAQASITMDKTEVSLVVGGTGKVNVSLDNSQTVLSTDVTSSNPKVATVSVAGNQITITGVAAGEAEITAKHPKDSTKKAACKVKVAAASSISLDKNTITVLSGESVTIQATLDNSKTLAAGNVASSNAGVAAVSGVDGNKITIKGVAAGSATVTAKHPDDNNKTAACTVTVKDVNSLLKDKDGNQVYIQDGNAYREAKFSDYDAIRQDKYKIFVRGEAKYTGWQTLNGKVYFFNANGDKVTGEQVIQGAKYQFASDGSLVQGSGSMGIDVSKYNGSIDWNAVKNSGVSYVIIRVGYRGYSQGTLVDDPKFAVNIKGAAAAGLKVGVYFFSQAVDEVEAVEEASMVLERIKGYTISYPVFLDVEDANNGKGRADSLSKQARTAVCKAFCETIRNAGYAAGIYANRNWLTDKIDANALSAYKIWLAQYAAEPTYKGRYDMWQYKSTGQISGISGNVDMNISYLGY